MSSNDLALVGNAFSTFVKHALSASQSLVVALHQTNLYAEPVLILITHVACCPTVNFPQLLPGRYFPKDTTQFIYLPQITVHDFSTRGPLCLPLP